MNLQKQQGALVISLDLESHWGVHDRIPLGNYRQNLLGERQVISRLLELFREYNIHTTWATVGFLFAETRAELLSVLPTKRPMYVNRGLSTYDQIKDIGNNESEDPLHFAASVIRLIAATPHQEIGTHTFSHFYCLEKGQDSEMFRADLEAAAAIADKYKLSLESLVFPRNQQNISYLSICRELGIKAYRGNERSWIYQAKRKENETYFRRGIRLLDAYIRISGHNCYAQDELGSSLPLNIPSSRFLRPFSKKLKVLEPLRLRRIRADLRYAAKKKLIYHLWWHPHNFGANTDENLTMLKAILDHFALMRDEYGMESLNMKELSQKHMYRCGMNGH